MYDSSGTKKLGEHNSLGQAKDQLAAIEISKTKGALFKFVKDGSAIHIINRTTGKLCGTHYSENDALAHVEILENEYHAKNTSMGSQADIERTLVKFGQGELDKACAGYEKHKMDATYPDSDRFPPIQRKPGGSIHEYDGDSFGEYLWDRRPETVEEEHIYYGLHFHSPDNPWGLHTHSIEKFRRGELGGGHLHAPSNPLGVHTHAHIPEPENRAERPRNGTVFVDGKHLHNPETQYPDGSHSHRSHSFG